MKSRWIKGLIAILGGIMLLAMGTAIWGTADLRNDTAKTSQDSQRAETLVREMAKAHGVEQWEKLNTYQATFEDEFLGFIGKNSKPFKEDKTQMELQYIPGSFDGKLRFLSGEDKGKTWGIQSWETYTQEENSPIEFNQDNDVYFWLPTYQYFIEFPARIQEATAFAYAGEAEIEGVSCEGVIASWNSTEPQKNIDQYLIWIDKESKRIVKLEYTIREIFNFLTGAAAFKEYKDYGGILLPSRLPVESNLQKEGFLHEMRILDFKADPVDIASLRPNKKLPISGSKKE